MMKVEPVPGNDGTNSNVLEAQYIRKLEMLVQAKERIKKVEKNDKTDISEHFAPDKKAADVFLANREEYNKKVEENLKKFKEYDEKKLNFHVNEETGQFIVQIVNRETGEVIREIPQEEMVVRMAKISGGNSLIDEKV